MNRGLTLLSQFRAGLASMKVYLGSAIGDVVDVLEEMDTAKADKSGAVSVTIPASGWGSDNTADYPYYCDLSVSGITARDRATVTIAPSGISTAIACGLCATNETIAGAIRIRSARVPAAAIPAQYWVDKGKE